MNRKNLILVLFATTALVQLYVPTQMIFGNEDVLQTGTIFKFKTRPIDPNDPFRGKFITLYFEQDSFFLDSTRAWSYPHRFYVVVGEDSEGFAQILDLTRAEPEDTQDYFLASSFSTSSGKEGTTVFVDFPFSTYFMEESKAYEAELAVQETRVDSSQITYALVAIKSGQAVLKDVFISGMPLKEVIRERRAQD